MYEKKEYDELRMKYNAGYLPSVWDKVKAQDVGESITERIKGL
jgi:hypothetical protein